MTNTQRKLTIFKHHKLMKLVGFALALVVIFASYYQSQGTTSLEKVSQAGQLVMLSQNGPTTYYQGPDGLLGFEYELGQAFANFLGVELVLRDESDLGLMFGALERGQADFAGATLTKTKQREHFIDFGPSYDTVSQKVIYRSGTSRPKKVEDLIGAELVVIADSSHEQQLVKLQKQHPDLRWVSETDTEMGELIEAVHNGEIQYAVVDSIAIDMLSGLYPRARVGFSVTEEQPIAWAFPKQRDTSLIQRAESFFALETTQTLIKEAKEKYFGHTGKLNFGGSVLFARRLESRLPKWRDLLQQAGEATEQDWRLLAAISYQESHWNPKAVSPTGVRGFMMLTKAAAKDVGVEQRQVAEQSIFGGARYFKKIYERIPEQIVDPDRLWLALAAYNIGFGHLQDARKLTEQAGQNPDKWVEVKPHLLSLSKSKYFKQTTHGFARGWEAVDYVENIRTFYSIIGWHERKREKTALAQEQNNFGEFSPVVSEAIKMLTSTNSSSAL